MTYFCPKHWLAYVSSVALMSIVITKPFLSRVLVLKVIDNDKGWKPWRHQYIKALKRMLH